MNRKTIILKCMQSEGGNSSVEIFGAGSISSGAAYQKCITYALFDHRVYYTKWKLTNFGVKRDRTYKMDRLTNRFFNGKVALDFELRCGKTWQSLTLPPKSIVWCILQKWLIYKGGRYEFHWWVHNILKRKKIFFDLISVPK